MPKLEFLQEEINDYLRERDGERHHFYKESVDIAESMSIHANGDFPAKLINERRPNEPLEVLEYRKLIYKPKTKPVFTRVLSSLNKIRRSADWAIKYTDPNEFPKIREGERLEDYFELEFPGFGSLTTWAFSELLRKVIIDPNAVVFVRPKEYVVDQADFLRPFPFIFDSCMVLDFVENDYAVLENPEGCKFYVRNKPVNGKSFYFVNTVQILRYDQVNSKGDYSLVLVYDHELGMLPVFKLGGLLIKHTDNYLLYESLLSGMIPGMDEAVREYSDLQASMVTSAYAERYEYVQNECKSCTGTGRRINPAFTGTGCGLAEFVGCDDCDSTGYKVAGPYSKIIVRPVNNAVESGSQIPTPPVGYVQKDVEIIKLQLESFYQQIYSALAAVNFQFLDQSPLNVSGLKTEVDKDELNNTAHSIAEVVVRVLDQYALVAARYRYKTLYSFEEIDEMLPMIPVPEKFDLIGSSKMADDLKMAKDGKFNPVIISTMEIDMAKKKFYADPEVAERVELVLKLDPLPNITEDDKMSRLSNKGITQETYIISSNIQEFVERALEENERFETLKTKDQKAILMGYAKEQMQANQPAAPIIQEVEEEVEIDPADPDNPTEEETEPEFMMDGVQ